MQTGHKPDFADPIVCSFDRGGTTVNAFVNQISSQLLKEFKYAMVWGTSSKHMPQRCGKQHILEDEGVCRRVSVHSVATGRSIDCCRKLLVNLALAGVCSAVPLMRITVLWRRIEQGCVC